LASIGAGAAANTVMNVLRSRILDGNMAPGIYVRYFIEDMAITLAEAGRMKPDLSGCHWRSRCTNGLPSPAMPTTASRRCSCGTPRSTAT
jgi:hypothetical protein